MMMAAVAPVRLPRACGPSGGGSPSSVCSKRKAGDDDDATPPAQDDCPARKVLRLSSISSTSTDGSDCSDSSVCTLVHGVKAVRGQRQYMEDFFAVQTNLMGRDAAAGEAGADGPAGQVNFYSVYDGHGGDFVAQHCSQALHQHLRSEMEAGPSCSVADALASAFRRTDEDLRRTGKAALVGSTAVVVLVTEDNYWVANCGDSRALLCRDGAVHSLTEDHSPSREDERNRIKESGGFVVNRNGVVRVMGALSVSRAIGDHVLQRYGVTWQPDIHALPRSGGDEFLLLASDGLFSVLTNEEATLLARRSLLRARSKGASRDAAARIAANVLTKVALHRGAQDNVTVVVVDLMSTLRSPSVEHDSVA